MAAAALGVGIVVAGQAINSWLQQKLGDDKWSQMAIYHQEAMTKGLLAQEPFPGFLAGLLEQLKKGLKARGYGEEKHLAPLYTRLEAKQNPAQHARALYASSGIHALLEHLRHSDSD